MPLDTAYAEFLAGKRPAAKDQQDEKHLCPLQLDVIERSLILWSNPGDRTGGRAGADDGGCGRDGGVGYCGGGEITLPFDTELAFC